MRIYGLSPGETTWLINDENTKFLRVPGGWVMRTYIYKNPEDENASEVSSVFIPYDREFVHPNRSSF